MLIGCIKSNAPVPSSIDDDDEDDELPLVPVLDKSRFFALATAVAVPVLVEYIRVC